MFFNIQTVSSHIEDELTRILLPHLTLQKKKKTDQELCFFNQLFNFSVTSFRPLGEKCLHHLFTSAYFDSEFA